MRNRMPLWIVAVLLAAGAVRPFPVSAEGARFVVLGKDVLVLAPPQVVASGEVNAASWSPDGRYVLALREAVRVSELESRFEALPTPPPCDLSLALWDREAESGSVIWKSRFPSAGHSGSLIWVPRTEVAFVLVDNPQARSGGFGELAAQPGAIRTPARLLLRVDARRGQVRTVGAAGPDAYLLEPATQPLAILFEREQQTLRFFRADGGLLRSVPFPGAARPVDAFWASDGAALVVQVEERHEQSGKESVTILPYLLDPRTGSVTPASEKQKPYRSPLLDLPVRLRQGSGALSDRGTKEVLRPLWLEGVPGSPPALVSPNADWGVLSPDGKGILFVASGAAWVTQTLRLPAEKFTDVQNAAARTVVISNGKQAALGLLIYANEHEDQLPAAGEPVRELVLGLKQAPPASVFDGFVYTFGGGKLSEVQEPSNTMLGYIPGPGGRAIVFVDGHVMWEKESR